MKYILTLPLYHYCDYLPPEKLKKCHIQIQTYEIRFSYAFWQNIRYDL